MSDRVLVGTRKGTFLVHRSNGRWTLRLAGYAGAGVNFVARDPNTGTLWAALGHGHWGAKLSRSTDDGESWTDATQIKYPEGARYLATPEPGEEDQDVAPPAKAMLKDASVLKLWTIAFGQPGCIYVGTIPGGLFVRQDDGESFELNLSLWNHESRGGGLFVARTQDGGESWEQLREGLPQENAYDVVYRHALGNSGDRLTFGSTTGNLYLSENRGESWSVVANNLPPIYSVRFG
jgi:hypothetical protein